MLVSLVIAALCVVYALAFCSGMLFQTTKLFSYEHGESSVTVGESWKDKVTYTAEGAKGIYEASQSVSSLLLILGIVMILCVVLNYISATNRRRKYYITNYITIGVVVAYALALAIVIIVCILKCQAAISEAKLDLMQLVYDGTYFNDKFNANNTWTFPVGYALSGLLVLMAVGYILNLVWKIKLMQGEKKLLESGIVKEVA